MKNPFKIIIKWIRKEPECRNLISYIKNQLVFESIEGTGGSIKISVGKFSRKTQIINKATQIALSLNEYQLLMCDEIKRYQKKDPLRRKLEKYRIANISGLTMLRTILASGETIEISKLSNRIDEWVTTMSNLIKIQMASLMEVSLDKFVIDKLEAEIGNTVSSEKRHAFSQNIADMIPIEKSFEDILVYEGITEAELDRMLKTK